MQIIIFLHLCCLYSHTMATLNALSNELSRLKIVVSESFMILVYAFGLLVYWRAYQFAVLKTFVVGESSEGSEQEVQVLLFRVPSEEQGQLIINL